MGALEFRFAVELKPSPSAQRGKVQVKSKPPHSPGFDPERTSTWISGSSSARRIAADSSAIRSGWIEFIALGRLIRSCAIRSVTSYSISFAMASTVAEISIPS